MVSFRFSALALAVLAVSGLANTVSAQQPVPFRGFGKITVTGAEMVPPNFQKLTGVAVGNATHLGKFTRTETVTVNLLNFTLTGKVVFTAANGDQLFADVAGGFTSPTTASGAYTFTGGTGRFQNATGTAAFLATAIDGGFAVRFIGKISY